MLTFSSPSLSKKRRFCSMACAETNCREGEKKNQQRNKVRSQVISSEFPESDFLPPLLTPSRTAWLWPSWRGWGTGRALGCSLRGGGVLRGEVKASRSRERLQRLDLFRKGPGQKGRK